MLITKPIQNIVFFDIETIPASEFFFSLSLRKQELFLKKFKKEAEELLKLPMDDWSVDILKDDVELRPKLEKFYNNRAALQAEFNQVVAISIGWFEAPTPLPEGWPGDQPLKFRTKSFSGTDEKQLLINFYAGMKSILDKTMNPTHHLCGHNIFMFDIPVLAKRFIINKLPLPAMLDVENKKEWNLPWLIDTRVAWKLTSFDGGCSLDLLCEVLGVDSSKSVMSGAEVRDTYYIEKDIKKIAVYCTADIVALAECYIRMKSMSNPIVVA